MLSPPVHVPRAFEIGDEVRHRESGERATVAASPRLSDEGEAWHRDWVYVKRGDGVVVAALKRELQHLPVFTRGEWEEIGPGQRVRRVLRDGVLDALDWDHKCSNPAEDFIPLRRGPATGPFSAAAWEIHSEAPLTISPSLLCTACQRHGFIRDGKWIPA